MKLMNNIGYVSILLFIVINSCKNSNGNFYSSQENNKDTVLKYVPKLPNLNSVDSIVTESELIIIEDKFSEKISVSRQYVMDDNLNVILYRSRELSIWIESKDTYEVWESIIDKKLFVDFMSTDEFEEHQIFFWGEKEYSEKKVHINARACIPESDSCYDYEIFINIENKEIEIRHSQRTIMFQMEVLK